MVLVGLVALLHGVHSRRIDSCVGCSRIGCLLGACEDDNAGQNQQHSQALCHGGRKQAQGRRRFGKSTPGNSTASGLTTLQEGGVVNDYRAGVAAGLVGTGNDPKVEKMSYNDMLLKQASRIHCTENYVDYFRASGMVAFTFSGQLAANFRNFAGRQRGPKRSRMICHNLFVAF